MRKNYNNTYSEVIGEDIIEIEYTYYYCSATHTNPSEEELNINLVLLNGVDITNFYFNSFMINDTHYYNIILENCRDE